ncbi:MAG: FAD-dependent oxidoreductase [Solobacterium sp.]|jgi:NADPH-dependent glutamate synthase beta subunit-like oxidoreductase|nr:FAD-dependent oxidoreductase [Solobacterium sp.]MCH4205708.1 FAD-dependent oxidoreductase [Solobacterium sp.]MCH4227232.1 FAD-dependent oxidoreductase [Solobacterium sp.]MCH4282538.1 FAD-dependent oxidoreductase [Solobacterium sp.]
MKDQKNRMTNDWDFRLDPNYVAPDPEKEKIIIQLAGMITDRMAAKLTHTIKPEDPEVWCLDEVLTKQEAKMMLSFKKTRVSLQLAEVAQRNGLTEEEAQKVLDHLCWIGCVETNRENADAHIQYDVPIFVPGIAEFMVMNDELMKQHPNIATFFNLMTQMPLEGLTPMIPLGGAGVGMHVIPVEKAIESTNDSVSMEHISHWLDKYEGKLSIGVCTCRRQQTMRGEGDGSVEQECCIGLGDLAEWCVNTGRGHYITKEEALEVCERGERHGFVHQTTNIDGEDKIVGLCNCAPGVCNAIRTSQLYNTPNMSRSAYRAHVDKENCVACGKCVEVCPVGAAKLGQKLCTKQGEIKYPMTLLPDETKWTADNWNPHYREDAKINCYETGTAPCKASCPAHLASQGYIKLAGEGKYLEALKLIKEDNPFPYVCGAVCNKRCEQECTRGMIDAPVAIDDIKRFIAQQELDADQRYIPVCETDHGGMWGPDYKMAIIGAGPAGLSCAYYLRERGYDVTVFEKEKRPGGMLMNGIPNFVLEKNVLEAEIDVLKQMGVEIRCGTEVGKDITIRQLREDGYKAFYLAIGLSGGRKTNVPGEDSEGVESAVSFLNRSSQDVHESMQGDVIVIGGGNVAVDVARTASRLTEGKVTMLCLEGEHEMPASEAEVAAAEADGVVVKNGWGPKEILTENGKAVGVLFKKCTQVKDADGRFNPQYDENETLTIQGAHVLEAIGQSAVWGSLLKDENVELYKNGYIKADPTTFQTSQDDIFTGGDIYHGAKFAIDAIAEGKLASESMHRFVHHGQSLTIGRDLRQFSELDKDNLDIEGYDNAKRQIPGRKKTDDPFKDPSVPLTEEQVRTEAKRCLSCGATTVDLNRCIGCGLCTTRCEFDAIHLERDLPDASRMLRSEDKMKLVLPYAAKREMKILFKRKQK